MKIERKRQKNERFCFGQLRPHSARLKANHSIAMGDCFAAAVSIKMSYPVITGDKDFKKLGDKVKIEWI